ncbi:MAG TPA: sensor histidine kinase [Ktedonobacteraceae bacterium]|jgi:signal transduction histidine kinase|nr:sensor histidine kinase [Ktedonobacteraceae bacterium]
MLEISDVSLTRVAQEAERRRIARELHDGAIQSLSALLTDLEHFRRHQPADSSADIQQLDEMVERWQDLARTSLLSMRQTLEGLRSHSDAEFDLLALIRSLQEDMQRLGYTVNLDVSGWPLALPFVYSSQLYYCIHEAVTNIRKHAQATQIDLFLFTDEEMLHVSVIDNGIGLSASLPHSVQAGSQQGLIGLQERVALLGGRLSLTSEPAQGTRVDIAIPLPH